MAWTPAADQGSLRYLCWIALFAFLLGAPPAGTCHESPADNPPSPTADSRGTSSPLLNPLRRSPETRESPAASLDPLTARRVADWVTELSSEQLPQQILAIHRLSELGGPGADALLVWLAQQPIRLETSFTVERELREMGPEALPALQGAIERGDDASRPLAWRVLHHLGPASRPLVPWLVGRLTAPQATEEDQYLTLQTLEAIGPSAATATPAVARIAKEATEPDLRTMALETLRAIGGLDPEQSLQIGELLVAEDLSPTVRVAAAQVLVQQTPRPEFLLPALIGILKQLPDEGDAATGALEVIGKLGGEGVAARPVVLERMRSDNPDVRAAAIHAVAQMGPADEATTQGLLDGAWRDDENAVRTAALEALAATAPAALSQWTSGLAQRDPAIVRHVLGGLPAVNQADVLAIPRLRTLLSDSQSQPLLLDALRCVRQLGPRAAAAVPEVTACLASPAQPAEVRAAAATALGALTSEPIAILSSAAHDDDPEVRVGATLGLALQDQRRRRHIPELVKQLAKADTRSSARRALSELGSDCVPQLESALFSPETEPEFRDAICQALGDLGAPGAPVLLRVLAENSDAAGAAETALWNMGPQATLPAILEQLRATDTRHANPEQSARATERWLQLLADLSGGMGGPAVGAAAPAEAAPPPAPSPRQPARQVEPIGGSIKATGADQTLAPAIATPELSLRTVKVFYGTDREITADESTSRTLWSRFGPLALVALALCGTGLLVWRRPESSRGGSLAWGAIPLTLLLAWLATRTAPPTPTIEPGDQNRPGPVFGARHADGLRLGHCLVTIPKDHSPGEMERPTIWKLQFSEDPSRHIVLQEVQTRDEETFHQDLRDDLSQHGNRLLVFVHGYNVGFDDAARRTAQLATDLEFAGVPVFFSWPSQANWYDYRRDEKQVELAVPELRKFLLQLAERSQAESIHLIAHSMGNRALTGAIRELQASTESRHATFQQVILAAPDIDADVFRQRIAPALVAAAKQVTLYASANDLALFASRRFNGGDPRVGDARAMVVTPGIETIDVSAVDTSLLGHSYYGDNPTVITDLKDLLRGHPAEQRPFLTPLTLHEQRYWVFAPQPTHPSMAERPTSAR